MFACEPDVGDVVGGTQSRRHTTTDFLRRNLTLKLAIEFVLNLAHHLRLALFGNRALAARGHDSAQDVCRVEGNAGAIAFDYHQTVSAFESLVGREAPLALVALTTTTHRRARISLAAVDHAVVVGFAEWADHQVFDTRSDSGVRKHRRGSINSFVLNACSAPYRECLVPRFRNAP